VHFRLLRYAYGRATHSRPKGVCPAAIDSGRLRGEEDAVKEALSLWEERERARAEILAAVDEAEAVVVLYGADARIEEPCQTNQAFSGFGKM
jgi:hypothetical protein